MDWRLNEYLNVRGVGIDEKGVDSNGFFTYVEWHTWGNTALSHMRTRSVALLQLNNAL